MQCLLLLVGVNVTFKFIGKKGNLKITYISDRRTLLALHGNSGLKNYPDTLVRIRSICIPDEYIFKKLKEKYRQIKYGETLLSGQCCTK